MAFISCGNINAGNAPITNPDYEVTMRVDIRAYSFHVSEKLIYSFRRIVQQQCNASRYTREPDIKQIGYKPPLVNNRHVEGAINLQFHEFFLAK